MRPSKSLTAAGLALCAAPAMACDLEAYGQQRFSPFAAMHGGGPSAPVPPADQPVSSDQASSRGGDQSGTSSGQDQASGGSDGAPFDAAGTAEPSTTTSSQEDAATFR